jgi:hypothetical protein
MRNLDFSMQTIRLNIAAGLQTTNIYTYNGIFVVAGNIFFDTMQMEQPYYMATTVWKEQEKSNLSYN